MSSNFFKVEEDDSKYDDVCDIRKNKNRTPSDVIEAFSGLECPATELHEWESHSKQYKDKFKKAKQCIQRRISTMKRFPARTTTNKTSRKKHIYPIQVAYAYGQDCLKKFASKKDQDVFKKSVDSLIKEISKSQPNVQSYFEDGIENSILSRTNHISNILERKYYDPDRAALINKTRNVGYNMLNNDEKEQFFSIINEAISRNIKYKSEFNNNNESVSPSLLNNNKEELINIIKKEMKKRRKTKKKSITSTSYTVNMTNLNSILQSPKFKITNDYKRAEIIKRINEIIKMFKEKVLIDEKLYILEDIYYSTFERKNKLNMEILTKTAMIPTTLKGIKQAGITAKNLDKFNAYQKRAKLGNDMFITHNKFREKLISLNDDILKKLNTGNSTIDASLNSFYINDLPQYILQEINNTISNLNDKDKIRLLSEKKDIYDIVSKIHKLNLSHIEYEKTLESNLLKQNKAQEMLLSPKIKSVPILIEKTKETLKTLKDDEIKLQKDVLHSYNDKTDAILEIYRQVNKKYDNPYIIKDRLETMIKREKTLLSSYSTMAKSLGINV